MGKGKETVAVVEEEERRKSVTDSRRKLAFPPSHDKPPLPSFPEELEVEKEDNNAPVTSRDTVEDGEILNESDVGELGQLINIQIERVTLHLESKIQLFR
jgi:hypothetical protein